MRAGGGLILACLAWAAWPLAAQAGPHHPHGSGHSHSPPAAEELPKGADARRVETWAGLALASGDPGWMEAADARLGEVLEGDPRRLEAWLLRARLAGERHRFAAALDYARRAEEQAPEDPRVWELLGDFHHALGHRLEAGSLYRQHAERWPSAAAHARVARWELSRGALDRATAAQRRALATADELPAPDRARLALLGAELAERRGDRPAALAALRRARALDPENPALPREHARLLVREGRAGEAVAGLRRLLSHAAGPGVWIGLAEALDAAGESQEADRWASEATEWVESALARGEPVHVRELVELLLARGGDPETALRLALVELREVRQDGPTLETAAWALYRAGRLEEAAATMRRALDRGDASPRLLARAGIVLSAAGRLPEARAVGRVALRSAHLADGLRTELERALAPVDAAAR